MIPVPGTPQRQKPIIYIDGFNFYYGAIKSTPHKWLNLERYFQLLRPHDQIQSIKYFTALVSGTPRLRQETYIKALGTLPLVDVIRGKFKKKRVYCSESSCTHSGNRHFETVEEKRTDVNIAVSMLDDAYQHACEQFVLVSGDSDLVPGVNLVRTRFPSKKIIVYVPHTPALSATRGAAVELRSAATTSRDLPLNLLKLSQFPAQIPDGSGGMITKPTSW
jgi:6-hydroxy-3-succinoylpyridine 3-monooxygenase